jgi:hypothetical protein
VQPLKSASEGAKHSPIYNSASSSAIANLSARQVVAICLDLRICLKEQLWPPPIRPM